jgi:hypothetical protein
MGQQARVLSLEGLQDFQRHVARFCQVARDTLEAATMHLRRAERWLEEERAYWRARQRQAEEELALARAELARVRIAAPPGEPPADAEAKLGIARAQRRIAVAQQAQERLQLWRSELDRALWQWEQDRRDLQELTGSEPAPPVVALQAILERLTSYLAEAPRNCSPEPEVGHQQDPSR